MNLDFAFLNWSVVSNFILKGLAFSVQLTLIALVGGVVLGTADGQQGPNPDDQSAHVHVNS